MRLFLINMAVRNELWTYSEQKTEKTMKTTFGFFQIKFIKKFPIHKPKPSA